ncbi:MULTISPECIES: hypothetical protein [Vibrio]|uniref:Uncharacterized protein n=1 Tax=Vibrio tasmaniensis TaxID=212663 RepID=A0A2N7NCU9_9VIBR|nr:hypothetical protein [Vibrio tasmaniensis]PMO89801.1 hypothetical protein BCT01_00535 [Vibrio tasmaniensis]PMP10026.1 hypothetical protein BCS92_02555 [Vibrio tasmaniensis]TKG32592.1 hypothetical protein FC057_12305 [Vibrio tasmaniensis]TKG41725.1 hypothetical protein FC063_07635 [Vibrio tasmaniensis]TKG52080.1 hypothetical protein FC070_09905 [Vibrio tasmaniensis]
MRDDPIKNEAEIADVAKVFLELSNWSLYPEVVIDLFNGRPDFIGVKGSLCQVIECKKTLSYPVIEQLARWQIDAEKRKEWHRKGYEQKIAVPHLLIAFVSRTNGSMSDLKKIMLEQYRIGVYSISKRPNMRTRNIQSQPYISISDERYWTIVWGSYEYTIHQDVAPKIQHGSRKTAHRIIELLNDDMRCAQAGVKGGETDYMTPFKRTMNRVRAVLEDGKELHIQHIINDIRPLGGHHYVSDKVAMASISKFIDKFEIAKRTREYGAWFVIENHEPSNEKSI